MKRPDKQSQQKGDPRKHPAPGYDEKNPKNKKDIKRDKKNIQDHPENQNTG